MTYARNYEDYVCPVCRAEGTDWMRCDYQGCPDGRGPSMAPAGKPQRMPQAALEEYEGILLAPAPPRQRTALGAFLRGLFHASLVVVVCGLMGWYVLAPLAAKVAAGYAIAQLGRR